MGESIHGTTQASQAMAAGLEADMMHDAVRGDAQLALLGALEGNAERLATAREGLKDHTIKTSRWVGSLGTRGPGPSGAISAVRLKHRASPTAVGCKGAGVPPVEAQELG